MGVEPDFGNWFSKKTKNPGGKEASCPVFPYG
jgi:hypothetical protein